MPIQTLSLEEVCAVHEALTLDFAETSDPIFPAGLRDPGLLQSAISRQFVGFAGKLKYETPVLSAATLAYGVCNNHAFHNGNKRTSVVALLVHLDKNGLVLTGVGHDELFKMILAVSQHKFASTMLPAKLAKRLGTRGDPDSEVDALGRWIAKRCKKPEKGERQIPYRELRRILRRFGFEIEQSGGNAADVVRYVEKPGGVFRRPSQTRQKLVRIGYRDEGTVVSMKDLKLVRSACALNVEHGIDSGVFYGNEAAVSSFVAQYRPLLRRLARR